MSPFRHLFTCTHLRWNPFFSNDIHFRVANACDADEYSGRSKIILAALFCTKVKIPFTLNTQSYDMSFLTRRNARQRVFILLLNNLATTIENFHYKLRSRKTFGQGGTWKYICLRCRCNCSDLIIMRKGCLSYVIKIDISAFEKKTQATFRQFSFRLKIKQNNGLPETVFGLFSQAPEVVNLQKFKNSSVPFCNSSW